MPTTTDIYPLSLHDALPISARASCSAKRTRRAVARLVRSPSIMVDRHRSIVPHETASCSSQPLSQQVERDGVRHGGEARSEEHTSELQSQFHLVCRLLLEKK